MGKKKKGAVCNNPVAMARAAGPPPVTGPTIRDYLSRDRPSLEEAAGIIASQHRRKESGALAAYEEQLNENYKLELKERRKRLLGEVSSHRSRRKDKKKKKKHSHRARSRSRSPHSTPSPHSDTEHSTRQRHKKHRHKSPPHSHKSPPHSHKSSPQPMTSRPSSSDKHSSDERQL